MRWINAAIASLAVLSAALPSATACPFCESETGRQVQAGIFNGQFWENVLATLLPFPILLATVALIYFDVSWLRNRHGAPPEAIDPSPSLPTSGE